jgi:hypothetical protein
VDHKDNSTLRSRPQSSKFDCKVGPFAFRCCMSRRPWVMGRIEVRTRIRSGMWQRAEGRHTALNAKIHRRHSVPRTVRPLTVSISVNPSLPKRGMLSLSLEIIEWIIDFFWDDKSALSVCALVGTGWRPRAHGHLFSKVLIHTLPRSAALISLLDDRPDLAPRIRTLQAWLGHGARQVPWFYSSSSAGFLSLLRRLPRLGALELLNFDWVEFERLNGPEVLHGTLFLELVRLVLPGDARFSTFLCTLPRLRALELVSPTWSDSVQAETSPPLASVSALQLQDLAISACWGEPSHRPWTTAISACSLSSLEMTVHGSADVEKWQILVDAACDTLRQIKVIEPETSRALSVMRIRRTMLDNITCRLDLTIVSPAQPQHTCCDVWPGLQRACAAPQPGPVGSFHPPPTYYAITLSRQGLHCFREPVGQAVRARVLVRVARRCV